MKVLVMGGGYYDIANDDIYSCIVKTANAGEDWITKYSVQNLFYAIHDIFAINENIIWAVGKKTSLSEYLILHTTDGGETWQEQTIDNTPEPNKINCVYFVNETTGFIGVSAEGSIYDYGAIYFTNNGGETWQLHQEFEQAILGIQMLNQDTGWAVGCDFVYHYKDTTANINKPQITNYTIKISPNPSSGIFTIDIKNSPFLKGDQGDLIITDITGKLVHKAPFRGLGVINISNQPTGIYFLKLKLNNQIIQTKKIIKL